MGTRAASISTAAPKPRSMSTAGWSPRASSRSSSSARASSSPASARTARAAAGSESSFATRPAGRRERHQALLRAIVEIALEAAPLDVTGGEDSGARGGELLEPGVELGVETVDFRLLRLPLGDVGVSDHVAKDPAGCVSDRSRGDRDGDERSILAQPHGFVVVHPTGPRGPSRRAPPLSARFEGGAIGSPRRPTHLLM